ncbi:MAG TPA: HAMP domain-containing sensor histidine kinase [Solirubrobacteraceae bacterium]|nr:HAMP domain-containing sensor histidine kinase [Solirubrobacteraceae bacterium]
MAVDACGGIRAPIMTALIAALGWTAALCALASVVSLRAATDRRMALVAEAAHELRAPLSAALLGLHGVVADAPGARRVAAVELELRRAGLALADLDAAPRGRRAPELAEPLEVRALLAEAVEGWRALAGALGGELLFDPAGGRLLVHADRLRLTQAVGNLVLNALEHGAGPVRIRAHATRTHVRIEVRDQGPGLPAPVAVLAADGMHARRRGHGLAVAARVVRRHGGRLLTAPVSAGACVVLELPRADIDPRDPGAKVYRRRAVER